jgi:hypothetical protein
LTAEHRGGHVENPQRTPVAAPDGAAGVRRWNAPMPGPLSRLLQRRRPTLACSGCGSDFLCPMDWEPADADHWHIDARCGACGLWHGLHLTNAQAAEWDVELDRQTRPIERQLRRLDRERMTREVETFATALRSDLIDAADFA